jgi:hypothetical protein
MSRKNVLLKSLILCISFSDASRRQIAQPAGELRIYAFPTQIGVIANRTFRDDKGRISKEIFYTLKNFAEPPYTEAMLDVQSVVIYTYDDRGLKIKSEHYDRSMNLLYRWETKYDDNKGKREIKYTSEGIRTYEIRYVERSSVSHLYYDDSGKNLVGIRGLLPQDIDLPFGWGEPVNGLSCGIAHTKVKSATDDSPVDAIYVNVKNIGLKDVVIEKIEAAEIELRDRSGALVKETAEYLSNKQDGLQKYRQSYGQLVKPGESGYIYPAYELRVRYGNLAPGQYSIRVRQPIGVMGISLLSSAIHFEVKR